MTDDTISANDDRGTGGICANCIIDQESTEAAAGPCPGDFIDEDGLGEDDNPLPPELMEEIDDILSPSFQFEILTAIECAIINTLLRRLDYSSE